MSVVKSFFATSLLFLTMSSPCLATDIYVDNLLGNDLFNGITSTSEGSEGGPVRTLRRAMQLAGFGDRIVLTRSGAFYYDSFSLTGVQHSGTRLRPFTIVGNGATLSGARSVPREGWRRAGTDVWKLTMSRKGFYRLMNDGEPVSELIRSDSKNPLAALEPNQWTAWRGDIYYKNQGDPPTTRNFSYAAEQTGFSLYQVQNVRIENLTLRDFRFDGLCAQNLCRNVVLDNVTCTNNGRSGVAVGGTSQMEIIGGEASKNGRHSILITGRASVSVTGTNTDVAPYEAP